LYHVFAWLMMDESPLGTHPARGGNSAFGPTGTGRLLISLEKPPSADPILPRIFSLVKPRRSDPPASYSPARRIRSTTGLPLARIPRLRHSFAMRSEIFTDGSCVDQTQSGGWAAVVVRVGQQTNSSSQEMEFRALVEAVKMAEGPCTVISDHRWIVEPSIRGIRRSGTSPSGKSCTRRRRSKDVTFEWRRRDQTLGQRLAHQLARDAARCGP
jgi:ribonuclease HI